QCYLRYTPPKIDAKIVGNERRMVDVRKKIIIDGSQTTDPAKPIADYDTRKYLWSCRSKDDPRNRYCRLRMSSKPIIRLPKNVLKKGSQYNFTLTVSSQENPGVTQTARQLLLGISTNTFVPDIRCVKNCAYGVYDPKHYIELRAECQDCSQPIDQYEWWVGTPEGESEDTLVSRAKFVALNYSYPTLSIRLRVKLRSKLSAEALFTLHKNEGPTGSCTVSPSTGIEVVTVFEINCRGFKTPLVPLYYRYVNPSTGIIGQNQYALYKAYLTETKEIGIYICDDTDMCAYQTVNVDVKPFQFKNPKAKPEQRIKGLLRNVKDLVKHGFWNKAMSRSLVATMHAKNWKHGNIIFNKVKKQEAFSAPQLERLGGLATQFVNFMVPMHFQEVHVLSQIFDQMSRILSVIVPQQEQLHPESYQSITAMHIFFMYQLSTRSELHAMAMCSPYNAECLNMERIRLVRRNMTFDPEILVEVNRWLMATWYIYKCVYYLGMLSSMQKNPCTEEISYGMDGVSYQINMTQVDDPIEPLTVLTIDNHHRLELSAKLLDELRRKLNDPNILFQIISQLSPHQMFWWYPYPMPAITNVLIIHAFGRKAPTKSLFGSRSRLKNPLVYTTNITSEDSKGLSLSGSIVHQAEIHYYSMILEKRAILMVRIINCSEPIYVNIRLGRRPTTRELVKAPCRITPKMKRKRVWMSNSCKRSLAFVSISRQNVYEKMHKYEAYRADPEIEKDMTPLNYTIRLEIHQCCHFRNRSIGPTWSAEYCDTQQIYGNSLYCTCYILGVLATRIFPILAEQHVYIKTPLYLSTEIILFAFLFALLLFLLLVGIMVQRFGTKFKKLMKHVPCSKGKLKVDPIYENKDELLIVILTGGFEFAGTTSNINIYLKSPHKRQHTFLINQDPGRPRLTRNSTNMMQVPRGDISIPTRLALGIVRNGRYPSWYCRTITVVDAELNRKQLFVVERWITHGYTRYMRSKYFHRDGREHNPRYTWYQRFRNRFGQLYISWFCVNAITGPWQTSMGVWTINRIERTAVLVSKVAMTITLVSLFYGRSTVEKVDEERTKYGSLHVHWNLLLGLSFFSFVFICIAHLFFEIFVYRWL
ncbi:hypothetical protein KR032_005500, partial [Drosophila birchii]